MRRTDAGNVAPKARDADDDPDVHAPDDNEADNVSSPAGAERVMVADVWPGEIVVHDADNAVTPVSAAALGYNPVYTETLSE